MFCEMCGKFTTVQKFIPPKSKAITRLIRVCPECFNHLNEQLTAIKIVSEIFEGMSSKMEDVKLLLSNNSLEFVRGYFTAKLLSYLRNFNSTRGYNKKYYNITFPRTYYPVSHKHKKRHQNRLLQLYNLNYQVRY